ncbi:MAG: VOC family protein [Anaerolineae bacterium]|nr:VOC family protein [Anaerolineae bacterium]
MSDLPISEQITFLYTREMAKSMHFYEEILGLPLALDQGGCRIYRVTGRAYVGICERDTAPTAPEGVIFTLVTPDVDAWAQRLEGYGVPFEKRPAVHEVYGIYHCFVKDPNGYLVEIQRFLDPDWDGASG